MSDAFLEDDTLLQSVQEEDTVPYIRGLAKPMG